MYKIYFTVGGVSQQFDSIDKALEFARITYDNKFPFTIKCEYIYV